MNSRILLLRALDISGINALFRLLNRNKAIILWYHGISEDNFSLLKNYDERHIPKSLFRKQLEYLQKRGYLFVSMTEIVDAIKNKKSLHKYVTLTFDDGFKNIVDNAYPIMKDFGARGCFYLVSDLVGSNELLWTDFVETVVRNQKKKDFRFIFRGETINYSLADKNSADYAMKNIKMRLRLLSDKERLDHLKQFMDFQLTEIPSEFSMADWNQINALDPDTMEIGSHTRMHPNCANLSTDEELENEIDNSKIDIEKHIGRNVTHFCYPAGSYNDRVIEKVKSYGYESAVTVETGFNTQNSHLHKLKRTDVGENFLLFKACISGSYYLLQNLKTVLGLKPGRQSR